MGGSFHAATFCFHAFALIPSPYFSALPHNRSWSLHGCSPLGQSQAFSQVRTPLRLGLKRNMFRIAPLFGRVISSLSHRSPSLTLATAHTVNSDPHHLITMSSSTSDPWYSLGIWVAAAAIVATIYPKSHQLYQLLVPSPPPPPPPLCGPVAEYAYAATAIVRQGFTAELEYGDENRRVEGTPTLLRRFRSPKCVAVS